MDMFKKMQGKRSRAIKQEYIALLKLIKVECFIFINQTADLPQRPRRRQLFIVKNLTDFRCGIFDVLSRIRQQRAQGFECV
jgi:hypothetical protein